MHTFFKKKLVNYININIFFILSIWFCIDTNFDNISPLFSNHEPWGGVVSVKYFFLFLRGSSPFIVFFILCFLSFFYKYKIQFLTKNKNLNFILIILYLNFLFQFTGLLISENNINNAYYIFVSLLSILSVSNLYNNNLNKINYLISLAVLIPIIVVYGYLSYERFLTTNNLNMYGGFPGVFLPLVDFSSNIIRSSGLSRTTMIILIPLFYLILIDKIKLFYLIPYSRLVYLIPYLILSSFIYFSQSRIVIIFFVMFSFFSIFYFLWNKTKKYKFQKIFILFLLPIIFVSSIINIKTEIITKSYTNKIIKFTNEITKFIIKQDSFLINKFKIVIDDDSLFTPITPQKIAEGAIIRGLVPGSVTTHRYSYWQQIILKSQKPIIGYGPLGDRFLINKNSSNTLVYSYASGGIISTILMLVLIIRCTYLCLFLTFIKKISLQKKNIFIFSSIFTISFLFFRGIGENGIAVFSIDLLVFLSCITICEKFKIQK